QNSSLVVVSRAADTPLYSRCRRPVWRKELAQGSARRINKFIEAKCGDPVRHRAASRIVIGGHPGERSLEHVHVRVGTLRKPPGAILNEPAQRVSVALLGRCWQRHGLPAPA